MAGTSGESPVHLHEPAVLPSAAAVKEAIRECVPIRLVALDGHACQEWEGEEALAQLDRIAGDRKTRFWLDLCSAPTDLVLRVSKALSLHPLLAEDLTERDQRAKLEQVDKVTHLVVFSVGQEDGQLYDRELDFVLGDRFLMSCHSRWWNPRKTNHLRMGPAEILARGPSYLLWTLLDSVVDDYFPILDLLGDEIDTLEDEVVARADRGVLERLFELKRQLIGLRRVTSPEREMFNVLSTREDIGIPAEHRLYFRDAYDHMIRLTDDVDTYRELASATLEAYLSTVNNNLSAIMKRLTGVTVVVAGIGAIGGIFGMSEAQYAFRAEEGPGFWIVVFGSLVLSGIAAVILHRIDWI